jgi:hypothetical protein
MARPLSSTWLVQGRRLVSRRSIGPGCFCCLLLHALLVRGASLPVSRCGYELAPSPPAGMPVVDDAGKLIGVVSDYDLLALDSISGPPAQETGLFPSTKSTWKVSIPRPSRTTLAGGAHPLSAGMGILHGDLVRQQEGPGLLRGSCWNAEALRV